MKTLIRYAILGLAAIALPGFAQVTNEARAKAPAVDPAATQILKRMTDYVGSLKQFSVYSQNTLQDVLDSGHRVDTDVSVRVIVRRPNKILAERRGDVIDQNFYYNGTNLTLSNPSDKVYATVPAPKTIAGTLDYARDTLGLIIPVSDLVYTNAYSLLMQDVTLAVVLGKAFIDGERCDHLLFSRPGVDFQVWVAEGGPPLPRKYVFTDTTTPELVSVSSVISQWNVDPAVPDSLFTFVPPPGDKPITFLPLITTSGSSR